MLCVVPHGPWLTWLAVSSNSERFVLNMQAEDADRLFGALGIVDATQHRLIQLPSDLDAVMPSRRANNTSQLEVHGQANFFARFLQYAVYLVSNNLLDRQRTRNLVEAIIATKNSQLLGQILQGQGPTARKLATKFLTPAIQLENCHLAETLLNSGANPNAFFDYSRENALQLAIKISNPDIVKLVVDFGTDPNRWHQQGFHYLSTSPLSVAAKLSGEMSASIIKILLDAGVNANGGLIDGPNHPLIRAVEARNAVAARLLIAADAHVNRVSRTYGTALGLATHQADVPMIQLLLEAEADVNVSWELDDHHRHYVIAPRLRTPIQVAVSLGPNSPSLEIANILLRAGANVNLDESIVIR